MSTFPTAVAEHTERAISSIRWPDQQPETFDMAEMQERAFAFAMMDLEALPDEYLDRAIDELRAEVRKRAASGKVPVACDDSEIGF